MIAKRIPDYNERLFYLSGPQSMVLAYEKVLKEMGLGKSQIKRDYFSGYA
jgi:ferredoxin-NADP reductase